MRTRYAVATIATLAVLVLAGYYSGLLRPRPLFEVEGIDIRGISGELHILVRGRNNTRVDSVSVRVELPGGGRASLRASYEGAGAWAASTPLVGKGLYRVCALNPYTGQPSCREYEFYDKPSIEGVEARVEEGGLAIYVRASDLSGVDRVLVSYEGRNYTALPLSTDERGNGVYRVEVPLAEASPGNLEFRVYVFDNSDRRLSSTRVVGFSLTGYEGFLAYCYRYGLNETVASKPVSYTHLTLPTTERV